MDIVNWWNTWLVECGVATQEEIDLVTDINGWNEESMLDILFARTGLRDIEQFCNEFDLDNPFEEDDEDEDEDEE